jgi:alpha-galactosidase
MAGVKLQPAFAGTGLNQDVRHFPDFASRLYFMEEVTETET